MRVKAAVLCGGRGERLRPLTDYFQKTMIPVGAKRRPLLEYIIKFLVYHRVREIVLLTGYKAEEIERYFEDGSKFGAEITYSPDPKDRSGTANVVANALVSKKVGACDELIVYYGDIISDLNVTELIKRHRATKADTTLVLDDRYTLPVGVAEVNGGMVESFQEKPSYKMNVTTGNMAIGSRGLDLIVQMSKSRVKSDLMTDFVPRLLKSRGRVAAYYTRGFWYDIGTVASYEKLRELQVEEKLQFLERSP